MNHWTFAKTSAVNMAVAEANVKGVPHDLVVAAIRKLISEHGDAPAHVPSVRAADPISQCVAALLDIKSHPLGGVPTVLYLMAAATKNGEIKKFAELRQNPEHVEKALELAERWLRDNPTD